MDVIEVRIIGISSQFRLAKSKNRIHRLWTLQHCFVDSDHAGDLVSRRSRTGVLVFVNRAPIVFYSKKQCPLRHLALDLSSLL